MAQVEPMDIDAIESDFDNKENAFQHNNVLPRTPCTEKGYEELDVSELNMKLRYSITPASSPMTKSLTGPCLDNRNCNSEDYSSSAMGIENGNLTRSLNSSLNKNDGLSKSKILPLQTLSTDSFVDSNRNTSIRRLLDPPDNKSIIISSASDNDENLSVPSSCSSVPDTPEATTPTKEIPKSEGSPILRGLKSVLSMFRPSQSPIPPAEEKAIKKENLSPDEFHKTEVQTMQVSTPVASKQKEGSQSKRTSPLKESLIFNDDLEKELQWKDDSSVFFKGERVPVHKLFFNNPIGEIKPVAQPAKTLVEYMDISCDETILGDKSMTDITINVQSDKNVLPIAVESDNEFLDCETTFTKNESYVIDHKQLEINNDFHITEDKTVPVSQNDEIPREVEAENKNIGSNIICEKSDNISVCLEQASVSITDFSTNKTDGNYTYFIEVTKNFLTKEYDFCCKIAASDASLFKSHKLDLHNESEEKSALKLDNKNTDIKVPVSEQVLEDNDVISTEPKPPTNISIEYNIIPCENQENISNTITVQEVCSKINDLSDVCAEKLDNIEDFQLNCNDYLDGIESKEDNKIEDVNLLSNCSTVVEKTEIIQSIHTMSLVPIMEEPSTTNKTITSTQFLVKESDENEFNNNKDITEYLDNELPLVNMTVNEAPISTKEKSVLNENQEIIEDVSVTKISKNEDSMLGGNKMDTNLQTCKKLVIAQTDLIEQLNVANISLESTLHETKTTDIFNHGSLEQIKVGTPSNSLSTSLKVDSEIKNYDGILISNPTFNILPLLNVVSDSDREIPELTVGNDVTSINLPSEIPLPIEDNTEQNNLLSNDECNKENIFEVHQNTFAGIENEIIAICTEYDNATTIPKPVEKVTEVNTDKMEIIGKEPLVADNLNVTQTCISQSVHDHMTEVVDSCIDNKTTSILLMAHENNSLEENEYNDIPTQQEINRDVIQDVLEIQSSENNLTTNFEKPSSKIDKEKVLSEGDSISSIIVADLRNTEKSDNKSYEKIEETSQVKTVDHQTFTLEKGLDEIDEEIITSANNSPYVSVTDLAVEVEKVEETDYLVATNNKMAMSPPISPKIVSKGYNFNFDEIDDPFTTKTKIRMSPTPDDTIHQSSDTLINDIKTPSEVPKKVNNRRKSQPNRKKTVQKKITSLTQKLTKTQSSDNLEQRLDSDEFSSKDIAVDNIPSSPVKDKMSPGKCEKFDTTACQSAKVPKEENDASEYEGQISLSLEKEKPQSKAEDIKCLEQTLVISTDKSTSSSEQYFSLGTSSCNSSGLMNRSKNVFNLPEIDDVNFNPFATKSKMRMSPPPAQNTVSSSQCTNEATNLSDSVTDMNNTTSINAADITFNKNISQDISPNSTNASCCSKNTNDTDRTVREIPTEDEDTVEGPFLDMEEFKDNEKLCDVESNIRMINFNEAPKVEKDENLENGELFIDADAFEFLLNQNKSTTVADSGKESLFLKFDPLFAKRVSSDGFLAALSKVQKRQSTPKKVTKLVQGGVTSIENPVAGPSNHNESCGPVEEYSEDLSSNVTKPMMVVNPAISSIITQKKSATPKLNRRSLTFTSPAMAVIDRLLSLSGNTSHLENDTSISQAGRERTETDLAITQLRELLAEKEINVHNLRSESKELKVRLAALEVQVRGLETESAERLAKINELNDRLLEKTKMNKSMATVVEEYERTIASLIAETEQDKKRNAEERMRLIKERDEQTAHLTSMEVSFSDLHSKYEKSKQIILKCKANEDICRKSIQEFQDNFSKMQNNYELLKQHATSKLNQANQELEKMNRVHEADVLKMNALIKRKELHITSLEETLAQKNKENEELTAICDELINKVG